ncbi:hypothetical protein [Algoriphagus aquimarinus]|uniref:hypothetical protein n=1 Tax=Algoriphagus aquimarinus TaxID=237018 RepID=UPI0030DC1EC5|tara:strand:+ start:8504 stop:8878 length:375 start_codon:yes stop_codon:yes gene_type:complete
MKINFEWNKIAERGQSAIGYVDVYELLNMNKAIAIIHYLPQYEQVQQRVMFTLIIEGDKINWTEGIISSIFEDAESRILNVEYFKFNNYNSLDFMDTQVFTVKNIDNFDYLSHGDYKFINTDDK